MILGDASAVRPYCTCRYSDAREYPPRRAGRTRPTKCDKARNPQGVASAVESVGNAVGHTEGPASSRDPRGRTSADLTGFSHDACSTHLGIDVLIDPGMGCRSAQAQDREESLIDSPHLLGREMTGQIAKSAARRRLRFVPLVPAWFVRLSPPRGERMPIERFAMWARR